MSATTDQQSRARRRVIETYDAASDRFDASALSFWSRHGAGTIEKLELRPGERVLDVGCGTGASAIPAALAVGPRGEVIGVDLSRRLLDLARRKAGRQGLENATFRQGDMTSLGMPGGSFDAVVCVFAIFFVPDMVRQVAELWRMVRPGGRLAVTTWAPGLFEPAIRPWRESVSRERPDLQTTSDPWDRLTRPDALAQLLGEGGVHSCDVTWHPDRQRLASPDDWWTVVMGSGLRWTVEQMDSDARARVRQANVRFIREHAVDAVETSALYATAVKPLVDVDGPSGTTGAMRTRPADTSSLTI